MTWLAEFAIVNALFTIPVAIVLFGLSRYLRRPALMHALWVLLLVKLVTPSPFEVDLGFQFASLGSAQAVVEEPTELLTTADVKPIGRPANVDVPASMKTNASHVEHASTYGDESRAEEAVAMVWQGHKQDIAASPPTLLSRIAGLLTIANFGIAWTVGACVWFGVQGTRIVLFLWRLRHARVADDATQQQCRRLAKSMGIHRIPRVWIVPGSVSPMLWAFASPAKLLFPRDLMARLDDDARATLLTHELAHFRRRDHFVRLLEFVVTGLYWWHPAVWIARREIEIAEEHCCDAWVVEQFAGQPRCYAEALLDTIDFLCEAPRTVPPTASGIGDVPFLRQRLTMIMRDSVPKRMTWRGRCALTIAALMVLPLNPLVFASIELATTPTNIEVDSTNVVETVATPEIVDEATAEESREPVKSSNTEAEVAWARATSQDGDLILTAFTNQIVRLRQTRSNESVELTSDGITAAAFYPDSQTVVTGCRDGRLIFRDRNGQAIEAFTAHTSPVRSICFAPDGSYFVTADRNGGVIIWHAKLRSRMVGFDTVSNLNCVRVSPDGRQLAVGSGDWRVLDSGRVTIWNVVSGERFPTQVNGVGAIGLLDYDANRLIAADWDGRLTTLDFATSATSDSGTVPKELVSAGRFSVDCGDVELGR